MQGVELPIYLDINHGKTHCSDAWHEQSTKYIQPLLVCVLPVERPMPQMWDLTNIQCFSKGEEPFIFDKCRKAFSKKKIPHTGDTESLDRCRS